MNLTINVNQIRTQLSRGDASGLRKVRTPNVLAKVLEGYKFGNHKKCDTKILKRLKRIPGIQSLSLRNCSVLTDKIGQGIFAEKLRSLDISGCTGISPALLQTLAASCPHLATLTVESCNQLSHVNDTPRRRSIGKRHSHRSTIWPSLQKLSFSYCGQLKLFQFHGPKLEELKLVGCSQLTSLQLETPKIKRIDLTNCRNLPLEQIKNLVTSHPVAILTVKGCSSLAKAPHRNVVEQCPSLLRDQFAEPNEKLINFFEVALDPNTSLFSIQDLELSDQEAAATQEVIRYCSPLRSVSIRNIRGDISRVVRRLLDHTSITSLHLIRCRLSDQGVNSLAQRLPNLTGLRQLFINGTGIGDGGMEMISTKLVQLRLLQNVSVSGHPMTSNALCSLGVAYRKNKKIAQLDLSGCIVGGDRWFEALVQHLSTNQPLSLVLGRCSVRGARISQVLGAFSRVDLRKNRIDDADVTDFVIPALAKSKVVKLGLSYNLIGSMGAFHLAEALRQNTQLKTIDLEGNPIGDHTTQGSPRASTRIRTLSIGTTRSRSSSSIKPRSPRASRLLRPPIIHQIFGKFTLINLCNSRIDDQQMQMIARVLKHPDCPILELGLAHNKITDQGAAQLTLALRTNRYLRKIDLLGNSIGDRGAEAFAGLLTTDAIRESLGLAHNKITDQGATQLALALRINQHLRAIDLLGNPIGDRGAEEFARLLTTNRTLTSLSMGSFGGKQVLRTCIEVQPLHPPLVIPNEIDVKTLKPIDAKTLESFDEQVSSTDSSQLCKFNRKETIDGPYLIKAIGQEGALDSCIEIQPMHPPMVLPDEVDGETLESFDAEISGTDGTWHYSFNRKIASDGPYWIKETGTLKLMQALQNSTLTTFRLHASKVNWPSLSALANNLTRPSATLSTLDLSHCWLERGEIWPLGEIIYRNRSIRELILDDMLISDDEASLLQEVLPHNTVLQTISLNGNLISEKVAQNIQKRVGGKQSKFRINLPTARSYSSGRSTPDNSPPISPKGKEPQ